MHEHRAKRSTPAVCAAAAVAVAVDAVGIAAVLRRLRLLSLRTRKRMYVVVAALQVMVCCIVKIITSAFRIKYPRRSIRIQLHVDTLQWIARNGLSIRHLLLLCC